MQINYINPYTLDEASLDADAITDSSGKSFQFINGAYRVVSNDNYTSNFGYQWNKFAGTQVDKNTRLNMSKTRFFAETNWDKEDMQNMNVLEVGSGAGRFSQIILDHTEANLYSVDYSNAVEANYKNNGPHDRLKLFQASIYELPFAKAQFDKVICIGVLQHTPNVQRSVQCLIEMVKPGGELIVDFYPIKGWWTKMHAKYLYRPFTKKLGNEKLFMKIDRNMDKMIKATKIFSRLGLGKALNRFVPICDIDATLPANLQYKQLREMCVLDTFDMFSPEFDQPQKINKVMNWFSKGGMKSVWGGYIKYENCSAAVVKGTRPVNMN